MKACPLSLHTLTVFFFGWDSGPIVDVLYLLLTWFGPALRQTIVACNVCLVVSELTFLLWYISDLIYRDLSLGEVV